MSKRHRDQHRRVVTSVQKPLLRSDRLPGGCQGTDTHGFSTTCDADQRVVFADSLQGIFWIDHSLFGKMQNDRHSRGIRQRRVYPENIADFYILSIAKEDQDFIGDRIVQHQLLNELSRKLIIEAKTDVEALIEGKLDTDVIMSGKLKAPTWEDIEKELEGI